MTCLLSKIVVSRIVSMLYIALCLPQHQRSPLYTIGVEKILVGWLADTILNYGHWVSPIREAQEFKDMDLVFHSKHFIFRVLLQCQSRNRYYVVTESQALSQIQRNI